jgi:hypothetical protein
VEAIKDGIQYLRAGTNEVGGVRYSQTQLGDEGRPVLTAAAIVCGFSAGEYNSPLVKQWFRFCRSKVRDVYGVGLRQGHDEYTYYYYYAQAIYMLGEDGWAKLFPDDKDKPLTWSGFRKASFDELLRSQTADGNWTGHRIGTVYTTPLHLCILQLDKAVLPIYQR